LAKISCFFVSERNINGAEQDTWIAMIIAITAAVPFVLIYARIMKLYQNCDLFDIALSVFGNISGRIIILLFVLYSILLASLVFRNFSEFVQIAIMPETPQLAVLILLSAVSAYIAFKGIQGLGKWCAIALPVTVFIVGLTIIICLPVMDFSNILPVMKNDFKTITNAATSLFSFPYGETVLFLSLASSVRKKDSPYKIYLLGLIFAGILLLITFLRNLFVLDVPTLKSHLFPSYSTMRIVRIGAFLTRLDASITSNFYLGGFLKISVCILGSAIGAAKLFNIKSYKTAVIPISIISVALSYFIFNNVMKMFVNAFIAYRYYSAVFQIILPLIIWIGAEIKAKKARAALNPGGEE
jgi:spore germination protein KB